MWIRPSWLCAQAPPSITAPAVGEEGVGDAQVADNGSGGGAKSDVKAAPASVVRKVSGRVGVCKYTFGLIEPCEIMRGACYGVG